MAMSYCSHGHGCTCGIPFAPPPEIVYAKMLHGHNTKCFLYDDLCYCPGRYLSPDTHPTMDPALNGLTAPVLGFEARPHKTNQPTMDPKTYHEMALMGNEHWQRVIAHQLYKNKLEAHSGAASQTGGRGQHHPEQRVFMSKQNAIHQVANQRQTEYADRLPVQALQQGAIHEVLDPRHALLKSTHTFQPPHQGTSFDTVDSRLATNMTTQVCHFGHVDHQMAVQRESTLVSSQAILPQQEGFKAKLETQPQQQSTDYQLVEPKEAGCITTDAFELPLQSANNQNKDDVEVDPNQDEQMAIEIVQPKDAVDYMFDPKKSELTAIHSPQPSQQSASASNGTLSITSVLVSTQNFQCSQDGTAYRMVDLKQAELMAIKVMQTPTRESLHQASHPKQITSFHTGAMQLYKQEAIQGTVDPMPHEQKTPNALKILQKGLSQLNNDSKQAKFADNNGQLLPLHVQQKAKCKKSVVITTAEVHHSPNDASDVAFSPSVVRWTRRPKQDKTAVASGVQITPKSTALWLVEANQPNVKAYKSLECPQHETQTTDDEKQVEIEPTTSTQDMEDCAVRGNFGHTEATGVLPNSTSEKPPSLDEGRPICIKTPGVDTYETCQYNQNLNQYKALNVYSDPTLYTYQCFDQQTLHIRQG